MQGSENDEENRPPPGREEGEESANARRAVERYDEHHYQIACGVTNYKICKVITQTLFKFMPMTSRMSSKEKGEYTPKDERTMCGSIMKELNIVEGSGTWRCEKYRERWWHENKKSVLKKWNDRKNTVCNEAKNKIYGKKFPIGRYWEGFPVVLLLLLVLQ